MIHAEHWPSLIHPGKWAWYIDNTDTGQTVRGVSVSSYMARCAMRQAATRQETK